MDMKGSRACFAYMDHLEDNMPSDPALKATLQGKSAASRASYTYALRRYLTITDSATRKILLMGRARTYKKLAETYPQRPTRTHPHSRPHWRPSAPSSPPTPEWCPKAVACTGVLV